MVGRKKKIDKNYNLFKFLQKNYPKILKLWDYKKNKKDPKELSPSTRSKYHWICSNCKSKSFYCRVGDITRTDKRKREYCKNCSKIKKVLKFREFYIKKYGSLLDNLPDIVEEWDYKLNDQGPDSYPTNSHEEVYFKCFYGHKSYKAKIYNKSQNNSGCPKCRIRSSRHEIRLYVELKNYFKKIYWQKKIFGLEADLLLEEHKIVIEVDGGWWHNLRLSNDINKTKKLEKNGYKVVRFRDKNLPSIKGNIFLSNLTKQLDFKEFKLFCIFLKNKFKLKELNKINKKNKFISNSEFNKIASELPKPPLERSLLIKHPKIAKEFDLDKNFPFRPEFFLPGSSRRVFWRCIQNHSWATSIGNRTRKTERDKKNHLRKATNCPECGKFKNFRKLKDNK